MSSYQPYFNIIQKHLDRRDEAAPKQVVELMKHNNGADIPNYVANMLKDLHGVVSKTNPSITFEQMMSIENHACGHYDYQEKLAFYCHQLSEQFGEAS